MSTNEYFAPVHSHVLLTPGLMQPDRLPVPIIHHTGNHVWISATYSDDFPDDVVQVTDGRDTGYDADGNKIVSLPLHYIERYLDDNEAEQFYLAADADAKLLRYAK